MIVKILCGSQDPERSLEALTRASRLLSSPSALAEVPALSVSRLVLFGVLIIFALSTSAQARPVAATVEQLESLLRKGSDSNGLLRQATERERSLWLAVALKALSEIENFGLKKVASIDVPDLVEKVKTVRIFVNRTTSPLIGSQTRRGSVYLSRERAVILNLVSFEDVAPSDLQGSSIMVLHEFMGALGFPDQNYEVSLTLYFASHLHHMPSIRAKFPVLEDALREHLKRSRPLDENIRFKLAGGVSGVGGGGEPTPVEVKMQLLLMLLQLDGAAPALMNRAIAAVLEQRIEESAAPGTRVFTEKGATYTFDEKGLVLIVPEKTFARKKKEGSAARYLFQLFLLIEASRGFYLPISMGES